MTKDGTEILHKDWGIGANRPGRGPRSSWPRSSRRLASGGRPRPRTGGPPRRTTRPGPSVLHPVAGEPAGRGPGRRTGWTTSPRTSPRFDVPTPILHGTADLILSIDGQGRRLHAALPDAKYVEIEGGPHVMCVTHHAEVNRELLAFLAEGA